VGETSAKNKIITRRANLSAWFETWWQMLRYNICSKKNSIFRRMICLERFCGCWYWHWFLPGEGPR